MVMFEPDCESVLPIPGEFRRDRSVTAAIPSMSPIARPGTATTVSLIALAVSLRVEGKTELLPCRPTIACTAQIEAPGVLVLEAGYLLKDLAGGPQHSVPFLVKLSLDDRLQLQLGSNGPTFAEGPIPQRFQDDLTLGAKLRLLRTDVTALSISATASLPIPLRQTGSLKTYDMLLAALLSRELPLGVTADLNLGLDLWRLERAPLVQPWAALSLNHPLPLGLTGTAEIYRFRSALPVATRDAGALFALAWQAADWLVLDGGGDLGLLPDVRSLSIFAGFTLTPARL
jgi:hypothetical protein